jgi:CheY-like chemotaxis protein
LGAGLEVIFLSLSMTNLIRNLRLEKERSHQLALKKSEEISGLKSSFMSNMSHELRTPLNAIMGVVDEQLALSENKGNRRNFEIIKYASISLLGSINDILDFDKIEKNELTLRHGEFDPGEALRQISDNWKIQAENKGIGYHFDIGPDLPQRIEGDRERLVQIINNVLSNAVKFTNSGSVQFSLGCTKLPRNNYNFVFRVLDTGVGIGPDMKAKIYESFGQMRLGDTRDFGGIGLGLNIVKHLVELFGGSIHLESWEGKGTEVTIELPFKGTPTGARAQIQEELDGPIRILVVEDNVLNQMVMRKFLNRWPQMEFDIVGNGAEALNALQTAAYNLVLMDIQMPVMDGYEATKIIRSGKLGEAVRRIPIIAVTADTTDETRRKVMELGITDYMTKPIHSGILLEKINNCRKVSVVRTV